MSRNINPRPQYFDGAGDPLISGKMHYFESGTDTEKDTFADVNLLIMNPNPVILTGDGRLPNVFFDGVARQKLTDSDDVQLWDIDPVGGEDIGGNLEAWVPSVIYAASSLVQGSDDNFYQSINNGNLGNDPTTTPSEWEQVEFISTWNAVVTYQIGSTVKGSDNLFYSSLVADNLNNDPVGDIVNWGAPFSPNLTAPGPIGTGTPDVGVFTDLTATVAFTSKGIDDNATAERFQVSDNGLAVGGALDGSFVYLRGVAQTTGNMTWVNGDTAANGGAFRSYAIGDAEILTNGVQRFFVDADGNIIFNDISGVEAANIVGSSGIFDLSANGAYFGGNAAANLLDDKETGTFTVGLTFGGAAVGMTIATESGDYDKIGEQVAYELRVLLSAKGSSTGAAVLTGLPFVGAAINDAGGGQVTALSGMSSLISTPFAKIANGASVASLLQLNSATAATANALITEAEFTDTTDLRIYGAYKAA